MGGDKTSTQTVRFAPYVEAHHSSFLNEVEIRRIIAINSSPYLTYTDIDIEDAFFGAGYVIGSYPSLYDMYGKFMAGLDIEVLFDQAFQDTINGPVVNNLITAEADILADDLETDAMPRFEAGMRDLNAVMSSTFVVGKAMMETARTKAISRFSADIRGKLLPIVTERWSNHLTWNRSVTEMYAQILKFYISAEMDVKDHNLEVRVRAAMWPFSVLQYETAALGALTGAQDVKQTVAGASKAQKAIGGAMMGAAGGAMVGAQIGAAGGPIGALGGAAIGAIIGLAGGLLG